MGAAKSAMYSIARLFVSRVYSAHTQQQCMFGKQALEDLSVILGCVSLKLRPSNGYAGIAQLVERYLAKV